WWVRGGSLVVAAGRAEAIELQDRPADFLSRLAIAALKIDGDGNGHRFDHVRRHLPAQLTRQLLAVRITPSLRNGVAAGRDCSSSGCCNRLCAARIPG